MRRQLRVGLHERLEPGLQVGRGFRVLGFGFSDMVRLHFYSAVRWHVHCFHLQRIHSMEGAGTCGARPQSVATGEGGCV